MPKRILIAEDEASVRNAVRTFIESRTQFEVFEAIDGDDAVKKADALKPDLVVLDLRMPIASGIEVAARLQITMPKTPVVIFTMFEGLLGKPLSKMLGIEQSCLRAMASETCSGALKPCSTHRTLSPAKGADSGSPLQRGLDPSNTRHPALAHRL